MKTSMMVAIGAGALLLGTAVVATRSAPDEAKQQIETAPAPLAAVAPSARQRINYAALDARLMKLMERPTMVGLTVGIVENGRITFLKGYGETLAGSGEAVTPQTVFRWASVSKGAASTMVA
ncbi:MAG: beta-lactamase family protein, partial [Pseudomonadota bacterium]|nr:beta-lactamase family protein [Pseudomonadota bacterium]